MLMSYYHPDNTRSWGTLMNPPAKRHNVANLPLKRGVIVRPNHYIAVGLDIAIAEFKNHTI